MKRNSMLVCGLLAALLTSLVGCTPAKTADAASETPPAPQVIHDKSEQGIFTVDHPELFPLATAGALVTAPELNVTGAVNPDISRQIPVISIATGRVIEIDARVGDAVQKGQLLFKVLSSDISQAFSDYKQSLADEALAKAQLERAKILLEKGAIAAKDLEVAVDVEEKAQITVATTDARLHVLGADKNHPTPIVEIVAPVSGVITDQQVTAAAGVSGLGSPNPFTISDLAHVWVVCDVYENDLPQVHLGDYADIHLAAYPNRVLKGQISNIGPVLDPNIRTAKVRLQVPNDSGLLRLGMFVTATFHGQRKDTYATVPSAAVLHLHDREWVYVPIDDRQFRRVEVTGGEMLPGNQQQILAGLHPGQKVITNALVFQNTVEQ